MLWIKGTKRLIALHLGLVLHQRPQVLIPVRAVLRGAWWDSAEVHPHSQPSQGRAQVSASSHHKRAEKDPYTLEIPIKSGTTRDFGLQPPSTEPRSEIPDVGLPLVVA